MLSFFEGCASLFNHTFAALWGMQYTRFLLALVFVLFGFSVFQYFYHGVRKL